MPRSSPLGVIVRDAHLQIDLRAHGYGRERLDLPPTPANINYAARMRLEILGKIERGSFVLTDYFPDSPRAKKDAKSLLWPDLRDEWLRIKSPGLQHSTIREYTRTLFGKHFTDWATMPVGSLDYRTLMLKLSSLPAHPKTFNNVASVLMMVLDYGHKAELIPEPLHQHIKIRKTNKPAPDPFTLKEVEIILAKMRDDAGRNYYEFAFFSGLRPSELIALKWANVDFRKATVLVDAAVTRFRSKGTKTGATRVVELNGRALAALNRQRQRTQVGHEHVFIGVLGNPYMDTDGPLDAWWKPAMRLSGIRQRDARQTRHTYATTCLHAGLKPGWVAGQLGHAVEMFYRVYSRWIDEQDAGSERRKLDAFLKPGHKPGHEAQEQPKSA